MNYNIHMDRSNFRIAEDRDFDAVVRLFKDATENMCSLDIFQWDELYPDESLLRDDIKSGHMYLLTEGKDIVSAVVIDEDQSEEYGDIKWEYGDGQIAVLHRLCVSPAFQNRGLGRETVIRAESVMKEAGYTAVRLDAFSENPFALRLYEGLGYRRVGEVTFRKGLFFVFEKPLR